MVCVCVVCVSAKSSAKSMIRAFSRDSNHFDALLAETQSPSIKMRLCGRIHIAYLLICSVPMLNSIYSYEFDDRFLQQLPRDRLELLYVCPNCSVRCLFLVKICLFMCQSWCDQLKTAYNTPPGLKKIIKFKIRTK